MTSVTTAPVCECGAATDDPRAAGCATCDPVTAEVEACTCFTGGGKGCAVCEVDALAGLLEWQSLTRTRPGWCADHDTWLNNCADAHATKETK